ncbi:hypothetical protein BT96DRAFT_948145 [Gymnopus androsaceus JB14]|uniref:Uncharacterized protein n=1 Tax=Gymnopus androsaceus JB14 TaxID=1447944 RepID=A0A6A4GPJ5_9AGAR|nr:hypothetical protein BT96DRAFT_948145 [Gymnopus androsaceus JB14]
MHWVPDSISTGGGLEFTVCIGPKASGPITYIFPYEPSAFGARKHSTAIVPPLARIRSSVVRRRKVNVQPPSYAFLGTTPPKVGNPGGLDANADITELVVEHDDDDSADDVFKVEEKPMVEELPMTPATHWSFRDRLTMEYEPTWSECGGIAPYHHIVAHTKKLHYSHSTFTLPETHFPVPQKLLAAIAALGDSDPNPDPHPPVPLDRLFASIAGAEITLVVFVFLTLLVKSRVRIWI